MAQSSKALESANSKLKPWHEQLADYMLANPLSTQREMADYFLKTEAWISQILRSDMFRAYYAMRREEVTQGVKARLTDEAGEIARLALVEIKKRLTNPELTEQVETRDVEKIARMGLESVGVLKNGSSAGDGNSHGVSVQVNVTREALIGAREVYRKLLDQNAEEAEIVDEDDGSAGRGGLSLSAAE